MYKHNASSIKESTDKQFVSVEDKQKWNNKAEGSHEHDQYYYTQEEIDKKFDLIDTKVQGKLIESNSTSGFISDLEVIGDTIRRGETLVSVGDDEKTGDGYLLKIKSHSTNMLQNKDFVRGSITANGEDVNWVEYFRTEDYIPVKPGTVLYGKFEYNKHNIIPFRFALYDENKNFIKTVDGRNSILIENDVYYIRVTLYTGEPTTSHAVLSLLETTYLSEREFNNTISDSLYDHINISLPVPLEGLPNIKDRLFRDIDGKLKIEKRIKTLTPTKDQLTALKMHTAQEFPTSIFTMININSLFTEKPYAVHWLDITSNILPANNAWVNAPEGIYVDASSYTSNYGERYVGIRINRSRFNKEEITISDIINYLVDNDFTIKYATENPEIIELADDISLRSYDDYTYIYSTNMIEPTIRCSIPYSLKSSIESNNNIVKLIDEKLHRIESVKEDNLTEYKVYGNGIQCPGTKNGFIESVRIEGDTILNIARGNHLLPMTGTGTFTESRYIIHDEPDRLATYRIPAGTPVNVAILLDVVEFTAVEQDGEIYREPSIYPQIKLYYTDGEVSYKNIPYNNSEIINKARENYLIEGTFTFNKDIEKIMISIAARQCTAKVTLNQCAISPGVINKSLLSFGHFSIPETNINGVEHKQHSSITTEYTDSRIMSTGRNQFVPNGPNGLEPFKSYNCSVYPEDANNIIVKGKDEAIRGCYTHFHENSTGELLKFKCYVRGTGRVNLKTPTNSTIYRSGIVSNKTVVFDIDRDSFKIEFDAGGPEIDQVVEYRNIEIVAKSQFDPDNFQPTVFDLKDLKTKSGQDIVLYGINNKYKDTIEKIDGKYYFVQRCNKIRITDTYKYIATADAQNGETTFLYQFQIPDTELSIQSPRNSIITTWAGYNNAWNASENECVGINYLGTHVHFRIKSEKLNNTHTVEALKAWLVDNPVEILYPLQQPIYHEMYNIDLQTFDGYTNIQTNSHVVHPTTTVVINDNIQNTLSVLVDKVYDVEDQLEYMDSAFLTSSLSTNHLDVLLSSIIDNK